MLYSQMDAEKMEALFPDPPAAYRGAPFWAWNNALDSTELLWQIEQLQKMGFGGFHMHVRTGLATEYLGDTFMEIVRQCVEKADKNNMLAWLYDEDRFPSGAAGGLVTRNPAYRQQYLRLTRSLKNGETPAACFSVSLNPDGSIHCYTAGTKVADENAFMLYAYVETAQNSPWFNNQAYLNTLDKKSVQAFIDTTYQKYHNALAKHFGSVVPAIFTDEPQFSRKETLSFADAKEDVTLPWTADLPRSFKEAYQEDILNALPELLWDLPENKPSRMRYLYHDHVAELFASAFADQCGAWCAQHRIMLTGHLMEEPTLKSQTAALGEAMRSYRSFQLPGIDMLCDWREYTTAKQAQSVARQYGRPGVMSEQYGVTNWDFDFRGHKLQGDWQAALGVTVRVPHLSWVSMNGEAKRDYPAPLNYQSPWYEQYKYIEDHFARVNLALSRGKPICEVAVIHPIESYWLLWGAKENTYARREEMDACFQNLTQWLLRGLIDFDFISESLFPLQCPLDAITDVLPVGHMKYKTIIVPPLLTMRKTTLDRLNAFRANGGKVIFLGEPPKYIDVLEDNSAQELAAHGITLPLARLALLEALTENRQIEIRNETGAQTQNLIYQMREEPDCRWLFISQADPPKTKDIPNCETLRIKIKGIWSARIYHTLTGQIENMTTTQQGDFTILTQQFYEHDSLLVKLHHTPASALPPTAAPVVKKKNAAGSFFSKVPVTLSEPNVLLLDMAEFALDNTAYNPTEEILRLDNQLREELGWPKRGENFAQPWVESDNATPHTLHLRYKIQSAVQVENVKLALENAKSAKIYLNNTSAGSIDGWYVDKCIETVMLPPIKKGTNILELSIPYGKKVDIEACYLLGEFGVRTAGTQSIIEQQVTTIGFGDITTQGLPFYGGNLTYHLEVEIPETGIYEIEASYYRGHLIQVDVDGKNAGYIAFSPYRLRTLPLNKGTHKIDITLYGCRINTFGQIHHVNHAHQWWVPDSWRTTGASWTYEYNLWKQGILKSINLFLVEKSVETPAEKSNPTHGETK